MPEQYRVINKLTNGEIWKGMAKDENQALAFAEQEVGLKAVDLRAEIVDTPLAGIETPETIDESAGQDKTHPLNKPRKPRSDRGIPRKEKPSRIRAKGKFYVFDTVPQEVFDSREYLEEWFASNLTHDTKTITVIQGRSFKVKENKQYKLIPE